MLVGKQQSQGYVRSCNICEELCGRWRVRLKLRQYTLREIIVIRIFLLIELIFVCMNFYVYFRARTAFILSPSLDNILLYATLFLILAPFIVHASLVRLAHLEQVLAYIAYLWLAFVFLFACVGVVLELYQLLIYLTGFLYHPIRTLSFSPQLKFLVPLILAITGTVCGYFAGKDITIDTINIYSSKIKHKISLMQISDVHLDSILHGKHLARVLKLVAQAKPDVLISTGDLIDPGADQFLPELKQQLLAVRPLYGKYAVTGNHEYYYGIAAAVKFTEEAGFKVLREQTATVANEIVLVGVDDLTGGAVSALTEYQLLQQVPQDKFVILLKHQPVITPASLSLFDLQLSGHTHRGQIFPFIYIVRRLFRYEEGVLHDFNGHKLYVSTGAGMWGPPIRLFAPPQVTVINLLPVGVNS